MSSGEQQGIRCGDPTSFMKPDPLFSLSWALLHPVVGVARLRVRAGLESSFAVFFKAVSFSKWHHQTSNPKHPSLQRFPKHTLTEAAAPGTRD